MPTQKRIYDHPQLEAKRAQLEEFLASLWIPADAQLGPLYAGLQWVLNDGGKRIRPLLSLVATEMFKPIERPALCAAAAVELVHNCSLILDDLPCMDGGQVRRGKRCLHLQFGEDVAILVAMALLNRAYQLLGSIAHDAEGDAELAAALMSELAQVVSLEGLIGGQLVDLKADPVACDLATLEYIHQGKTGSLFAAALRMGALVGGAAPEQLERLSIFARHLGLAYQIADDLLDSRSVAETGKQDSGRRRADFVTVCGPAVARERATVEIALALRELQSLGAAARPLGEITESLLLMLG